MAKVKNQIYDGSEETYTDASGAVHYFGELFRHIMPNAYPLPSLNPVEVARKSNRGYHPTEQGPGSREQFVQRQCFQQCSDQWHDLPDECPEVGTCPQRSSKRNVWNAKQLQGVMCAYYDLFMGCCLSECTEISITGPTGIGVTGGTIPSDSNCWPCVSPCKSSDLEIEYTTKQMFCGDSQTLQARDSVLGLDIGCCPTGDFSWEILEGSGMLEPDSGPSVVYTAPDFNGDCKENPRIQVIDCCGRRSFLDIAVSQHGADPNIIAVITHDTKEQTLFKDENCPGEGCTCPLPSFAVCNYYCNEYCFNCFGERIHGPDSITTQMSYCCWRDDGYDVPINIGSHMPMSPITINQCMLWSPLDNRNDLLKESGCCPEQLLI